MEESGETEVELESRQEQEYEHEIAKGCGQSHLTTEMVPGFSSLTQRTQDASGTTFGKFLGVSSLLGARKPDRVAVAGGVKAAVGASMDLLESISQELQELQLQVYAQRPSGEAGTPGDGQSEGKKRLSARASEDGVGGGLADAAAAPSEEASAQRPANRPEPQGEGGDAVAATEGEAGDAQPLDESRGGEECAQLGSDDRPEPTAPSLVTGDCAEATTPERTSDDGLELAEQPAAASVQLADGAHDVQTRQADLAAMLEQMKTQAVSVHHELQSFGNQMLRVRLDTTDMDEVSREIERRFLDLPPDLDHGRNPRDTTEKKPLATLPPGATRRHATLSQREKSHVHKASRASQSSTLLKHALSRSRPGTAASPRPRQT